MMTAYEQLVATIATLALAEGFGTVREFRREDFADLFGATPFQRAMMDAAGFGFRLTPRQFSRVLDDVRATLAGRVC
jgi:hypothetical protein